MGTTVLCQLSQNVPKVPKVLPSVLVQSYYQPLPWIFTAIFSVGGGLRIITLTVRIDIHSGWAESHCGLAERSYQYGMWSLKPGVIRIADTARLLSFEPIEEPSLPNNIADTNRTDIVTPVRGGYLAISSEAIKGIELRCGEHPDR